MQWQRADLLKAKISANKMNIPQGLSYTEREYYDGSGADKQSSGAGSLVSYLDGSLIIIIIVIYEEEEDI